MHKCTQETIVYEGILECELETVSHTLHCVRPSESCRTNYVKFYLGLSRNSFFFDKLLIDTKVYAQKRRCDLILFLHSKLQKKNRRYLISFYSFINCLSQGIHRGIHSIIHFHIVMIHGLEYYLNKLLEHNNYSVLDSFDYPFRIFYDFIWEKTGVTGLENVCITVSFCIVIKQILLNIRWKWNSFICGRGVRIFRK